MRTLCKVALALVLALPAASTACRSSNAYDPEGRASDVALLIVENQNFNDVDIYAVSTGLASRIGTVSGGNSTARFAINPTMYNASDFRLVATPIGGNGRASSGPLLVSPGRTIKFTITPNLATSHAEVQ
jgi:hypothetical protein